MCLSWLMMIILPKHVAWGHQTGSGRVVIQIGAPSVKPPFINTKMLPIAAPVLTKEKNNKMPKERLNIARFAKNCLCPPQKAANITGKHVHRYVQQSLFQKNLAITQTVELGLIILEAKDRYIKAVKWIQHGRLY